MRKEYYDELVSRSLISVKICKFCGENIIGRKKMIEHIKLKHKRAKVFS